ncbi:MULTISPECIES: hypothetical protein [unclassified Haladaptatus]|uniref:mechanosensitive ion channel family protein n=1 Tax=unclassified Haladaptatus TaxID=2622732 RepID=UPI0023E8908A|nr:MULTISPECIES: hypothetical protein [unclassified Haladaptatus]
MQDSLTALINDVIAFIPNLVGALLILLIGWIVARAAMRVVEFIADRIELDRVVLSTPLGDILGGTEKAVSHSFGLLAYVFVLAVAVLAAADALAVPLLSQWISEAVTYLPSLIAGLLIIVLGFVVADFIGDAIQRTRAATETAYTSWFATGVRLFLYFTVVVIGLDTMGVDVELLYILATAFAGGIAVALALGVGIALGWGGKDYVAQNIAGWMSSARGIRPDSEGPMTGGETPADDD